MESRIFVRCAGSLAVHTSLFTARKGVQ